MQAVALEAPCAHRPVRIRVVVEQQADELDVVAYEALGQGVAWMPEGWICLEQDLEAC